MRTSIFKQPVAGPVRVGPTNLAGDRQSDPSVHGGPDKAVYIYPSEHYPFWREQLPKMQLPWGMFGENLTTEGLVETEVRIGDRLRIGTAEFAVTQPRMPCFKLGLRFGRPDMLKRFLESGRSGFYVTVLREGTISAGDAVEIIPQNEHRVTVADVVALYTAEAPDRDQLMIASELPGLSRAWCAHFRKRLQ